MDYIHLISLYLCPLKGKICNNYSKNKHMEGFIRITSIISSSALSMLAAPGLPEFGYVVVIGLISFLSLKEVLSASKFQGKTLESSLNMGIAPLLVSFIAIVIFKIAEIL